MDKHLTIELLQNYERHKLSGADLDIVNDHLYRCETCYETFLTVLQHRFPIEIDLDELAGLKGWHLQGAEMAAYVGGRMNELDFYNASRHVRTCADCRTDFYDECERQLESTHAEVGLLKETWRALSRVLHRVHSIQLYLQTAGISLAVLGLLFVAWLVVRPSSQPTRAQTANPPGAIPSREAQLNIAKQVPIPTRRPITSPAHFRGGHAPVRTGTKVEPRLTDRESASLAKNLVMPAVIKSFDRSQEVVVRGSSSPGETFSVLKPYGTVITTDRPTFSWTPLSGAEGYTVSVYDENLNLVETSEPLTETRWTIPYQLRWGSEYTWIVTALKSGKNVVAPTLPARAEFKVIEGSELLRVNHRIERTESHALRGLIYAEVGLLDQAEEQLRAQLKLRLNDARAQKLLNIVRSWRGAKPYIPPAPVTTKPAQ